MNMRVEHHRTLRQGRSPGLAAPNEPPPSGPRAAVSGSRFLEPLRLTEAQKRTMIRELGNQRIGDQESCQLFTGAVEYQLGTFHHYARLEEVPAPTAGPRQATPTLAGVKQAADALLGSLDRIPPERVPELAEAVEEAWRAAWIRRLRCELHRLAKACDQPAAPPPVEATVKLPAADAATTRRFVRSMARTFEECFEQQASLTSGSAFRIALDLLTSAAGIRLGSLDTLAGKGPEGSR